MFLYYIVIVCKQSQYLRVHKPKATITHYKYKKKIQNGSMTTIVCILEMFFLIFQNNGLNESIS